MSADLLKDLGIEGGLMDEEILPPPRNSEKKKNRAPGWGGEKRQPTEWEMKGCVTVDDPEEKERMKKELEKKEKQRQAYKKWYEKQKAKKAAEKAAAEEKEDEMKRFLNKEAEPAILEEPVRDLEAEYEEQVKEGQDPDQEEIDHSLERLRRLKENMAADEEDAAETQQEDTIPTEVAAEVFQILADDTAAGDLQEDENAAKTQQEEINGMFRPDEFLQHLKNEKKKQTILIPTYEEAVLHLTASKAESLRVFIEGHLMRDIREDPEIDNMEWLADMCEIWRELEGWQK